LSLLVNTMLGPTRPTTTHSFGIRSGCALRRPILVISTKDKAGQVQPNRPMPQMKPTRLATARRLLHAFGQRRRIHARLTKLKKAGSHDAAIYIRQRHPH
jgi:hypothetical protein